MLNQFGDGSAILLEIQNAQDAAGNPAQFVTPPVWSSSDPTIFNPTSAADGLSATGTALKTGTVTPRPAIPEEIEAFRLCAIKALPVRTR